MCDLTTLQDRFVHHIPAMQKAARFPFRKLPPEARQEAIANSIAICWKFFYALFLQGRHDEPSILNSCFRFAIRHTKCQ